MTNIEKLTKAINFIASNGQSLNDFVVVDGLPYRVTGYFHDYQKGTYEVTKKDAISEEQAGVTITCSSTTNKINTILVEKEERTAKQLRLANFYASEEY